MCETGLDSLPVVCTFVVNKAINNHRNSAINNPLMLLTNQQLVPTDTLLNIDKLHRQLQLDKAAVYSAAQPTQLRGSADVESFYWATRSFIYLCI